MIFTVEITEQADSDLRAIYEYIFFELQSPENAIGQLERLEKSIISLEEMPERCQRYEKEPWYSRGLRIFPVDNYVVCYIADTERNIVTVIRVMYGGRDIEHQLNVNTEQ